jgi:uncharacterized membrane protein
MFQSWLTMVIFFAALGAGLMAGVYFAFSGFIMRSFDGLGALSAANAMNAINEVILRSWFMIVFFGSTLLFCALCAIALLDSDTKGRWLLFSAGLIYVCGMFLCTVFFNVPLNNQLRDASNDGKSAMWKLYYTQWIRWNHLRCIASSLALILCMYYLMIYT